MHQNPSYTPCPSAPLRRAPVAFPVDSFTGSAVPRSNVMPPGPINEKVLYHGHIETLSLVIFGKIAGPL